jgi:hypothetical protein
MRIRHFPILALLTSMLIALGGCAAAEGLAAADVASVAVFGRDIVDIGVSAVSGRDCSIVRLDQGTTYCAPKEHLPGPLPYCSRSLADVQCWSNPERLNVAPRAIADQPALTPEQVRQTEARWPKSINLFDE